MASSGRFAGAPLLASFTLMLLASACGGGKEQNRADAPPGIFEQGVGGRGRMVRAGLDANAAYTQGVDLKAKGDCKGAVVKLRPAANIGPGYENAQTALGQCLVELAGMSDLSADYLEGMTWLRRAADGGWPEAQIELAQIHAFGPQAIRNGEEAAYWLALYEVNSGKSRIGFVGVDPSAIGAIKAKLTPQELADGQRRAAQWQRNVWLPPTPTNGPGLTSNEVQVPQAQQRGGGRGPR